MSQDTWSYHSYADFEDLARRRAALRQAAAMPGADPLALLDATLVELDAAVDAAAKLAAASAAEPAGDVEPASLSAERGLLRAVFHDAPAALFLLELDGTIRRGGGQGRGGGGAAPPAAAPRA